MKSAHAILLAAFAMTPLHAADEKKPEPASPPINIKATPKAESKNVTPDEAEKLIAAGATVIDVRTPEEYDHEHIKGAVNVNVFDNDFDRLMASIDTSKPVVIHCQAGRRSTQALEQLAGKSKFPQIYHMNGGINAWKTAKKPLETKPLPRGALPEEKK